MSLAPIPARMLHDTVTLRVVTGMDRFQEKTYEDHTIQRVHLQSSADVVKGPDNTEVQLRGVLFIDARKSLPVLDPCVLQQQSLAAGDTMRAIVTDASGTQIGDYAVLIVETLPDVPANRPHHWELSLV